MSTIIWFKDSPDAGDPSCICSWCGKQITEEQAPAVRMFDSDANTEARFHHGCYMAAMGGSAALGEDSERSD